MKSDAKIQTMKYATYSSSAEFLDIPYYVDARDALNVLKIRGGAFYGR